MNKNKYEDYMTQNHIQVLTLDELMSETPDVTKFFGYPVLGYLDDIGKKFKIVYEHFDKSENLLLDCHARNAYEEASLHDLRHAMEILFYQVKEDFPGKDMFEHGALCDSAKTLVSIFIHLPNIMHCREKDDMFNYLVRHNLLVK